MNRTIVAVAFGLLLGTGITTAMADPETVPCPVCPEPVVCPAPVTCPEPISAPAPTPEMIQHALDAIRAAEEGAEK